VYSSLSSAHLCNESGNRHDQLHLLPDGNLLTKVHAGVTIISVLDHKNN